MTAGLGIGDLVVGEQYYILKYHFRDTNRHQPNHVYENKQAIFTVIERRPNGFVLMDIKYQDKIREPQLFPPDNSTIFTPVRPILSIDVDVQSLIRELRKELEAM